MKRQIVIVLQGKGEMGKSTTLYYLIQALKNKKPYDDFDRYDKCDVIYYKDKKIGVTTSGDNKDKLKRDIEKNLPENCDIIVCAARTKGSSVDYINDHFKKDLIIWLGRFSALSDDQDFDMEELQKKLMNGRLKKSRILSIIYNQMRAQIEPSFS